MSIFNSLLLFVAILAIVFWYIVIERFTMDFRTRTEELSKIDFGLKAFFTAAVKAPSEGSSIRVKEGLIAEINDGKITSESRVTRALTREL
jgi:hypothetical protein